MAIKNIHFMIFMLLMCIVFGICDLVICVKFYYHQNVWVLSHGFFLILKILCDGAIVALAALGLYSIFKIKPHLTTYHYLSIFGTVIIGSGLIFLIGCIYCEIIDIRIDLRHNGEMSQYYEKYAPLLDDPVQQQLLAESEQFFENYQLIYYLMFGVLAAVQVVTSAAYRYFD